MISIDNFTVTVISFPEFVGADWTLDNPQAVLQLTPNTGYQILAQNFSATNPLPTYVSSVSFLQDGTNILCTITYTQPSIMPAQDVFIDVCFEGLASPVDTITVNGEIDYSNSTAPIPSPKLPVPYSGAGAFDETNVVANILVNAGTGNFFVTQPTAALAVGELSDYQFTTSNTLDADGDIIQTNIIASYTYPQNNVTGDVIEVFADMQPKYNPPIEVQGYVFDTSPVGVGGITRPLQIIGVEGAAWNVEYINSGGTTVGSFSGVLDNTGQATISIGIPATTTNETYTFQISGDLAPTFCTVAPYSPCATGQPAVWDVLQIIDQDVSFVLNSTDPNITLGAADTQTFTYGTGPGITSYSVSATSTQDFIWNTVPTAGDFTNQGASLPDTNQIVQAPISIAIDNAPATKTLSIDLDTNISYVGATSLTSTLDLDNFLSGTYQPIQVFYSATSAQDACCTGTLVNAFVQNGETFANAVAILDSQGNPAADGYYYQ